MSRFRLVQEIAQKTGRGIGEASRYVSEVGPRTARRTLRSAEDGVSWRLPATVAVGTGGVLAWRHQNVREAEAVARESESAMDALAAIIGSDDLTPEQKAYLSEIIAGVGSNGDDDSSRWPDILSGGGGMEGTILTIIIVVIVLAFVMDYATSQLPQPNVGVQAGVS